MEYIKKLLLEVAEKNGWCEDEIKKLDSELIDLVKVDDLLNIRGKLIKIVK